MENNYALVGSDGVVRNIIVWDGLEELSLPEGCHLVEVDESARVEIGAPLE